MVDRDSVRCVGAVYGMAAQREFQAAHQWYGVEILPKKQETAYVIILLKAAFVHCESRFCFVMLTFYVAFDIINRTKIRVLWRWIWSL